jgi:hypothetical protein
MLDLNTLKVVADILKIASKCSPYDLENNRITNRPSGWNLVDTIKDAKYGEEGSGNNGQKHFIIDVDELKPHGFVIIITLSTDSYGSEVEGIKVGLRKAKVVSKVVYELID